MSEAVACGRVRFMGAMLAESGDRVCSLKAYPAAAPRINCRFRLYPGPCTTGVGSRIEGGSFVRPTMRALSHCGVC